MQSNLLALALTAAIAAAAHAQSPVHEWRFEGNVLDSQSLAPGSVGQNITFISTGARYDRDAVPDRLFSEAMRGLDLNVSVAYSGGIDPEASSSTVAMRAALIDDICRLFELPNVSIDGSHMRIDV